MQRIKHRHRGHALRKGRVSMPSGIYLITTVTAGRTRLFEDFDHARIVASALHGAGQTMGVVSYAWVVMPDHLHWLVGLGTEQSLPNVVRRMKGGSAHALTAESRCHGRVVWQPGYHDHALRDAKDLRAPARYIVANPLRAGIVEEVGD